MDIGKYTAVAGELPLDNILSDGGFCGIFRTIGCIGDSLSSGEFVSTDENGKMGYHDYFEYSWGQYIARAAGLTCYNFSKGGLTAEGFLKIADERGYFAPEKAAQAYIIALGVNDILYHNLELGTVADIDVANSENNKNTFAGYYAKIISKYKQLQPKARFFLMTMLHEKPEEDRKDSLREMQVDAHAALLHGIAELFDFTYVLDFAKYAPVYDENFKRNFYMSGHLNAAGYLLTSRMVASYIDYIIRNNPDDFAQVGFIGKNFHNRTVKW